VVSGEQRRGGSLTQKKAAGGKFGCFLAQFSQNQKEARKQLRRPILLFIPCNVEPFRPPQLSSNW
jgi:hypothetical protein